MTLYLYKIGTEKPVLTVENAQSYTADSVTAADGTLYEPLAENYVRQGGLFGDSASRLPRGASHTGNPFRGTGGAGGGADVRR